MEVPGYDFLPGSGLAEDKHIGIAFSNLLDHFPDILNRAAAANQTSEQVNRPMGYSLGLPGLHIDLGLVQGTRQLGVIRGVYQDGRECRNPGQ